MSMNPGDALTVYSGGVFRQKDIKPIELGAGQDLDGVDVVFPISGLHAVAGTVVAKTDNHAVNSGTVELEDGETKAMVRMATINRQRAMIPAALLRAYCKPRPSIPMVRPTCR